MSATKSMAKNFSWLLIGSMISGTINFASSIFIARLLGAATFGLFRFAQALLAYMILAVDSGLSTLGTLEIAKAKGNALTITANILVLRAILAATVFLLGLIVVIFAPISWDLRALFVFTFIYVFYRAINIEWAFQGLEKMTYIAISKVLYAIVFFLLLFVFVKSSNDFLRVPVIQSFAGLGISLIFLFIFMGTFAGERWPVISKANMSKYFYQAIPLGASAFLIQIYNNMDTILLGFLSSARAVGIYSSAYQIYYIALAFYIVWQATAIPVAGSKIKEDKQKAQIFLEKYLRLTMLAVIPAVILVFIASPLLIGLLYGNEYKEAATALRWLIWTMIPCAVGYTYGVLLLIPSGHSKGFLLAVAGGALINIVLNLLLIPQFNYVGAAIATFMAETAVALIAIYLSKKIFYLSILPSIAKPCLFSFIALLLVFVFYPLAQMMGRMQNIIICVLVFLLAYSIAVLCCERKFIFNFINEVIRPHTKI